jgi:hypothetical protein
MTTRYKIYEQIQRLLSGNPIISGRVQKNDIKLLIGQVSNKLLKAEHFSINMPEGDSIPPNCMIYTYESVPVVSYGTGKSKCTLPSMPINLPKNVGVFHISKTNALDEPFVPIPSGLYGIIKPQSLLGQLSGLIGYEVYGSTVIFTQDLPANGANAVFMRLVGVDIESVDDYTILPITADMEADIVTTVYQILVGLPVADKQTND